MKIIIHKIKGISDPFLINKYIHVCTYVRAFAIRNAINPNEIDAECKNVIKNPLRVELLKSVGHSN